MNVKGGLGLLFVGGVSVCGGAALVLKRKLVGGLFLFCYGLGLAYFKLVLACVDAGAGLDEIDVGAGTDCGYEDDWDDWEIGAAGLRGGGCAWRRRSRRVRGQAVGYLGRSGEFLTGEEQRLGADSGKLTG